LGWLPVENGNLKRKGTTDLSFGKERPGTLRDIGKFLVLNSEIRQGIQRIVIAPIYSHWFR